VLFRRSSGYGFLAIHGNHAHRDPPVVFYNEKQNKNTSGIAFEFSLFIVLRDQLVLMYRVGQVQEVRDQLAN